MDNSYWRHRYMRPNLEALLPVDWQPPQMEVLHRCIQPSLEALPAGRWTASPDGGIASLYVTQLGSITTGCWQPPQAEILHRHVGIPRKGSWPGNEFSWGSLRADPAWKITAGRLAASPEGGIASSRDSRTCFYAPK